jgi:2',3'-cyclic-nucleotide 2'-phosphodiesterase (5'-nucleotidase family)
MVMMPMRWKRVEMRVRSGGRVTIAAAAVVALGLAAAGIAVTPTLGGPSLADVRLVVSVNCKTLLETCGCASDKTGGFPEKAALLEKYRRESAPLVVLDAGDAVDTTDLPAKTEVMIRAMGAAGYGALNIGDQEAGRGLGFIKHIEALTPMAIVSSNLVVAATGALVAKPFVILNAGGAKIGVLGVVSAVGARSLTGSSPGAAATTPANQPQVADEPLAVRDPVEAIKRYLPQVRKQADAVVVLAHVSAAESKELARIPGVDVVVGSEQRSDIPDPELIGGTLWIEPPAYGRFLGVVRLTLKGGRLRPAQWRIAKVPWRGPRQPQVAKIIEAYTTKETAAMVELMNRTTTQHEGYSGFEKCAQCHADIAESWKKTRHANGWETLKRAGHRYDPECLPCHTTGDPRKLPSVALKGVQCEDCHLPMNQHGQYDSGARHEKDVDWEAVCVRCHDGQRSPGFDLAKSLPLVNHKNPQQPGATPDPKASAARPQ